MIKVFEILGGGERDGLEIYPAPNVFNTYITHRVVGSNELCRLQKLSSGRQHSEELGEEVALL